MLVCLLPRWGRDFQAVILKPKEVFCAAIQHVKTDATTAHESLVHISKSMNHAQLKPLFCLKLEGFEIGPVCKKRM